MRKPGRSRALFSSTIRSLPPFADEHIGYLAGILIDEPPVAFLPISPRQADRVSTTKL
jgi:hypothetical protein